jgi:hypothetical protein
MNNIIDTFQINKSIINKNEINNEQNNEIINNEYLLDDDIVLKKKKLIELTSNLTKIEYMEILNIIQKDKCPYSNNSNGVFVNLINIENNTIDKIFDFLKFTKQKKEELEEKEIYLEKFKNDIINNDESNIKIKSNTNINPNSNLNSKSNFINEHSNQSDNLSDTSDNINYDDYLCFSSDDEDKK